MFLFRIEIRITNDVDYKKARDVDAVARRLTAVQCVPGLTLGRNNVILV